MFLTDVECFFFVVATLRVVGGLENLRHESFPDKSPDNQMSQASRPDAKIIDSQIFDIRFFAEPIYVQFPR